MRLTIHLLGAELLSVELSRSDPPEYPDDEDDPPGGATSGATGGQFEMGFTVPPDSIA